MLKKKYCENWRWRWVCYILLTHYPVNISPPHTLSTHPINIPSPHTLLKSIQAKFNPNLTLYNEILRKLALEVGSLYLHNISCQHILLKPPSPPLLSTHPFNLPPSPYQPRLVQPKSRQTIRREKRHTYPHTSSSSAKEVYNIYTTQIYLKT